MKEALIFIVFLGFMSCGNRREAAVQKNDPAGTINENRESRAEEPGVIAADPAISRLLEAATENFYQQSFLSSWVKNQSIDRETERVAEQISQDQQWIEQKVKAIAASYGVALPSPDSVKYIKRFETEKSTNAMRASSFYVKVAERQTLDAIHIYEPAKNTNNEQVKQFSDSALARLQLTIDFLRAMCRK